MKKIIYDCDTGIDDALAIILALKSDAISVEAITCVFGNSPIEKTTLNTLRILDYFKKDIPVAKGEGKPLIYPPIDYSRAIKAHGVDGLGDSKILPLSSLKNYETDATDLILKKIKSGVRILIATGALTNIAKAFEKDMITMNLLDEIIIMGGVINEAGNIDRLSEANFYNDPHAADFVLQQKVKKILIPLNVTHKVIFTIKDKELLPDNKTGNLIKSIIEHYQKFYINNSKFQGCPLHDPLAMGYAIDPTLLKLTPMNLKVETVGKYTRGVCVPELREKMITKMNFNVDVALEVNDKRFLKYFIKTISQ